MIRIWILLLLAFAWAERAEAAWAGRIAGDLTLGSWKHSQVLDSRLVNTATVNISAGMEKWFFYLGPSFEYFFSGQLTNPNNVNGTSVLGRGYLAGAMLALNVGSFRVSGTYEVLGKYIFSKMTGAGEERSYSSPNVSWRASLGYKLTRVFSIDAVFRKMEFKQQKLGSERTEYALGSGFMGSNYGLGFSLQF